MCACIFPLVWGEKKKKYELPITIIYWASNNWTNPMETQKLQRNKKAFSYIKKVNES